MNDIPLSWSAVRVWNPHGFERWSVYRSDCRYLSKSGEWGAPIDGAEFGDREQALAHGRKHAPELEHNRKVE